MSPAGWIILGALLAMLLVSIVQVMALDEQNRDLRRRLDRMGGGRDA